MAPHDTLELLVAPVAQEHRANHPLAVDQVARRPAGLGPGEGVAAAVLGARGVLGEEAVENLGILVREMEHDEPPAEESPRVIVERLLAAGDAWARGRPADGDVTFVVLKVREP